MYSIHQTYFLIEKRLEHRLHDDHGITFSQFLIMLGLHCNTRTSQSAIANFLYITEATVSRHITQLEKAKLLTKKEDPENRRKHILTMTPKGTLAFTKAHTLIEAELKFVFGEIPTENRHLIEEIFDGIITRLSHK